MAGFIEVAFCLLVLYWLFNARASAMVGVISTRVQEVYTTWSPNGNGAGNDELKSATLLRNIAHQKRKRRAMEKDCDIKLRDNFLYQIKEQPTANSYPQTRPIMGLACKHCSPTTAESQVDPIARRRDVRDILRIGARALHGWSTWTPHLAQCWKLRKFPYPQVADSVLGDERLERALDQATKDTLQEEQAKESNDIKDNADNKAELSPNSARFQIVRKKHEERAKRVLLDMRSKLSDFMLRMTSWVLYKLLPCFLTGVAAHPAQIDMLRIAADKAGGAPLIFMPLHRSHLDYILISFILLNNDIRSPLVAAGNNLRIPFFGSLLRGLGAFYIKRRIDPAIGKKDHVYRAILHTYLQQCLGAGHNVEFFIEGGRTRTGKPCMPKGGILSVIVDAYMDGTVADALLVPVSVNYERLVDGNFIREQLGQSKQMESFGSAIRAIWGVLHSNYGVMRLDFNEPFSIRELVKSFGQNSTSKTLDTQCTVITDPQNRKLQHNPSTTSLYGTDIVMEEHRTLVDSIGRHVVYDSANATAIMSTNAVSFLLLTQYRQGCEFDLLVEALDKLRMDLETDQRDLGFTGYSKDVISYVIKLLGPSLIVKEIVNAKMIIKPVVELPNVIELSYYSNCLVPYYALKSIVVTSLHSMLVDSNSMNHCVSQDVLVDTSLELCDMLRYEFILHKPCQNLGSLVNETIDNLCSKDILSSPEELYNDDETWSRRFAKSLEVFDNSDEEELIDQENFGMRKIKPIMSSEAMKTRRNLIAVLSPLLNGYLCAAHTLTNLLSGAIVESEFTKRALREAQTRVDNKQCDYGESVSTDSMRNAIKLFEKWGVVEISRISGVRLLQLGAHWDTMDGVETIIGRFRKFTEAVSSMRDVL